MTKITANPRTATRYIGGGDATQLAGIRLPREQHQPGGIQRHIDLDRRIGEIKHRTGLGDHFQARVMCQQQQHGIDAEP